MRDFQKRTFINRKLNKDIKTKIPTEVLIKKEIYSPSTIKKKGKIYSIESSNNIKKITYIYNNQVYNEYSV